ncbi:hypothetical protein F5051DRAFT_43332 [Lentinula edodes]|nr:hypothetical protein F5051DRAFT_43332 [Lentinula edodes]
MHNVHTTFKSSCHTLPYLATSSHKPLRRNVSSLSIYVRDSHISPYLHSVLDADSFHAIRQLTFFLIILIHVSLSTTQELFCLQIKSPTSLCLLQSSSHTIVIISNYDMTTLLESATELCHQDRRQRNVRFEDGYSPRTVLVPNLQHLSLRLPGDWFTDKLFIDVVLLALDLWNLNFAIERLKFVELKVLGRVLNNDLYVSIFNEVGRTRSEGVFGEMLKIDRYISNRWRR